MHYTCSSYTAIGGRENNEDAFTILEHVPNALFVVADGLGGMDAGEVASGAVVQSLKEAFLNNDNDFPLVDIIQNANEKLLDLQRKSGKQMMTTVTAVYCHDNRVVQCAHVGDSRIYVFGENSILYQSVDHSVSQMAVFNGEITPEEIRNHEDRNKLTRVLGNKEVVKIDVESIDPTEVKAILLCSDGFWEYIYEEEMILWLKKSADADEWLSSMREIVWSRVPENNDNNTAVAVIFER